MPSAIHDLPTAATSKPRPSTTPRRSYVFILSSLTAFVLGLIIWRAPIYGYVAGAILAINSNGTVDQDSVRLPSIEQVRAVIVSETFVRDALYQTPTWSEPSRPISIPELRQGLRVSRAGPQLPAELHVNIQYASSSSVEALRIVRRLARQFAKSHPPSTAASLSEITHSQQDARQALQQAQTQESAARASLDRFLAKHFNALSQGTMAADQRLAGTAAVSADANSIAAPTSETGEPGSRPVDPESVKLHDELNRLSTQYDQLLELRTSEHPEVRQLGMRIQRLKDEMQHLPESTKENQDPDEAKPGGQLETATSEPIKTQYRRLQKEYELARHRLAEAELFVQRELADQAMQDQQMVVSIIEPARVIARLGGIPSVRQLVWLTLVSLALGLVLAWASAPARTANVCFAVDDIEQQLGLPVVGAIATGDGRVLNKPSLLRSTLIALIIHACEATLAGIVFFLMVVAVFDSPFAAGFADDPFGALSELISRMTTFRF